MTMHLHSVNLGRIRRLRVGERDIASAIGKQPTPQRVRVHALGLDGDEQADPTVHGGLRKAIYAYNWDHYAFWRTVRAQAKVSLWDEELPAGLMGENLTIPGLDEAQLWIGDRLVLPDCVLVVSEPRMPCGKFNAVMGFNQASRLMNQSGYCGTYLAVLQPGTLQAGEAIRLEPGPRELPLRDLFRSRIRPDRD
jgi:MOSC domain-containing protein YiiM